MIDFTRIYTFFYRFKKIIKKPPGYVAYRIIQELKWRLCKYTALYTQKKFTINNLFSNGESIDSYWNKLIGFPTITGLCGEVSENVFSKSSLALKNKVDLLGMLGQDLGEHIKWFCDYKTGNIWPKKYCKSIDYYNLDSPSDVKIPWEISRMQWLIPLGQAYVLTGDDKYAEKVKNIILDWINKNPYSYSVNWSCTMEVAIRIIVWIWFYTVFRKSKSWSASDFREKFLSSLYLHACFTHGHIEKSDINGNHYITDAAGLVFAGIFFKDLKKSGVWLDKGWGILKKEITKQVSGDGVDYEGSVPYHRLVTEIFLYPAIYRMQAGLDLPSFYRDSLISMGHYIAHYSRTDGTAPLLGDADDARLLPLGQQNINDHRYLVGMIAYVFKTEKLRKYFSGPTDEIEWLLSATASSYLKNGKKSLPKSKGFSEAGYYVMRNFSDHVFIDCAPVGLANRGGHGHNDCLSFELVLNDCLLIVDSGAYIYTGSYEYRNKFRSTASHNTPIIDGKEINRFVDEKFLWSVHYEARPTVLEWEIGNESDIFVGSHTGYHKLGKSVSIKRKIELYHKIHDFELTDEIFLDVEREVKIPFHFHPDVVFLSIDRHVCRLRIDENYFICSFEAPAYYKLLLVESEFSPRYGHKVPNKTLILFGISSGLVKINMKISRNDK